MGKETYFCGKRDLLYGKRDLFMQLTGIPVAREDFDLYPGPTALLYRPAHLPEQKYKKIKRD